MGSEYVPWIIAGLIIILIAGCIYMSKHKNEALEVLGIENPDKSSRKKIQPPRMNKKKKAKPTRVSEVIPAPPVQNSAPKKKQPTQKPQENDEDDNGFSDLTLNTDNSPVTSFTFYPSNGLIHLCCQNGNTYLYAIFGMDHGLPPFRQVFSLTNDKILATAGATEPFRIMYAAKSTINSTELNFEGEEATPVLTPSTPTVPNAYRKTIQSMITNSKDMFIATLVNHKDLIIYDYEGNTLFTESYKDASDMISNEDISILYVAAGSMLVAYKYDSKSDQKFVKLGEQQCVAEIVSISYQAKTKNVIVTARDNIVRVFKEHIDNSKALVRQGAIDVGRIAVVNPVMPYIAVVSKSHQLSIYNIDTWKLTYRLEKTHEGNVDHLIWHPSGTWIFLASKNKGNCEIYRFTEP